MNVFKTAISEGYKVLPNQFKSHMISFVITERDYTHLGKTRVVCI